MAGEPLRLEGFCKQYDAIPAANGVPVPRQGRRVSLFRAGRLGQNDAFDAGCRVQDADLWSNLRCSILTRAATVRRNIGGCFDVSLPQFSVSENAAFALKMRGVFGSGLRAGVAEALSIVQLGDYQRRMPRQLPDRRQQRVAFAHAVVFRPVLMGERSSAGQAASRAHVARINASAQSPGNNDVTQDQTKALTMSDRIVVMNEKTSNRTERQGNI